MITAKIYLFIPVLLRHKLLSPNISKKSDENVFKNMKYNKHVYHIPTDNNLITYSG